MGNTTLKRDNGDEIVVDYTVTSWGGAFENATIEIDTIWDEDGERIAVDDDELEQIEQKIVAEVNEDGPDTSDDEYD